MKDPKKRAEVLMEAAGWFLRIEDGPPLSEAEKSKFLAWLQASPLRVRTYLSAARVARCLPSAYKEVALTRLEEAMLKKLGRPLDQSDSRLPVAIRRKGNGARKDNGVSTDS